MRFAWVFALGVCLACAACLGDQRAARTEAVVHVICECTEAPLPKVQEQCIDETKSQIPALSDQCIECILANSNNCNSLMAVCQNDCQRPQPNGRETP